MSAATMPMPSIQGQAVELFSRAPPAAPVISGRPASRGSISDNKGGLLSARLSARPSTSASQRSAYGEGAPGGGQASLVPQGEARGREGKTTEVGGGRPPALVSRSKGKEGSGGNGGGGNVAPEVRFVCVLS